MTLRSDHLPLVSWHGKRLLCPRGSEERLSAPKRHGISGAWKKPRQNGNVVESNNLEVEAVSAVEPGLTLRRVSRFFLTLGREELDEDHYPSVVVVNRRGQRLRLFGASNWDEAIAKRDRLRAELEAMGEEAWRDRYKVPSTFVQGDSPEVYGTTQG